MKPGRNDPCPCGSGKKYKQCCSNLAQLGAQAPAGVGQAKDPSPGEQNQLIALYQSGRHAELEQQAMLLLKRYPESGFGWKILSAALSSQGKDALEALQWAARLLPQDAQVYNNLGDLQAKREKLAEAEVSFRRAIFINPEYSDAYYNLGQVLIRLERYAEALGCLKQAIAVQPDNVEALLNLGVILRICGQHDEALEKLRLAQQFNPDSVDVNNHLGGELAEQGKFAEAEIYCRRALSINPEDVVSRTTLVSHKKIKADDKDFAALRSIENSIASNEKSISVDGRIRLNFALGKCFDDTGDADRAFHHFAVACGLKRATFRYDANENQREFEAIKRAFNIESVKRLSGSGLSDRTPIFVLGMPRSGTTLTEQIIASHPEVHGAGELYHLLEVSRHSLAGIPYPANFQRLDKDSLKTWGREYLDELKRHAPHAGRITDKMPQNFQVLGLIHLMLPNAKIIHVRRNPVDTCLSCFTMNFVNKNLKYSYDLVELARFYVDYVGLMRHWHEVLPKEAFLEVQYEDLIQDSEGQARRLIDFCGLDWSDDCLNFHKSDRSVRTASVAQVRQPMYRSSIERWKRYEQHLGPLLETLGDLVPGR
ncbi:MAG: sulfotransferase [Gallionella sp.]|nr:sulfotransferase [Gallionella sp.]